MNRHRFEYIDRRRFERVKVKLEISYKTDGKFTTEGTGSAKDLCEGGMALHLNKYANEGDKVELEFRIPGYYRPIKATASIAWMSDRNKRKRLDQEKLPTAGLRFTNIEEDNRKRLFKYISEERGDRLFDLNLGRSDTYQATAHINKEDR
jgi:uncharacterized protein (TIGR02266 family)